MKSGATLSMLIGIGWYLLSPLPPRDDVVAKESLVWSSYYSNGVVKKDYTVFEKGWDLSPTFRRAVIGLPFAMIFLFIAIINIILLVRITKRKRRR